MRKTLLAFFAIIASSCPLLAQDLSSVSTAYVGDMFIALGADNNPAEDTPMPQQTVNIQVNGDAGSIDFSLQNFAFSGMVLGDISLPGIPVTEEADGRLTFGSNSPVSFNFLNGSITATASLNTEKSYISGDSIYAKIDVIWTNGGNMPINVLFIGRAPLYQLRNSGFEEWSNANEPAFWHSFKSAGGTWGWAAGATAGNTTKVEGRNGGNAVQIISKSLLGKNANGNVTTGRINMGSMEPTDAANYNYTDTKSDFNSPFTGMPDSVCVSARFTRGGADNNARGNFILHGEYDYKDPMPAEEAEAAQPYLVAQGVVTISPCTEWTRFCAPMTYADNEYSYHHYMLASFSTNPIPGATAGDTLQVDSVQFIYNSRLASVSIDGTSVTGFDKDIYNYYLNTTYDTEKSLVQAVADGRSATVEQSYNKADNSLTLTVKGGDYLLNPSNVHKYVITFSKTVGIENVTATSENVTVYDLEGRLVRGNVKAQEALKGLPAGIYIVNGKKVSVR